MKRIAIFLTATLLLSGALPSQAQGSGQGMGSPPGPDLSGGLLKLFENHTGFSARMELQLREESSGNNLSMPGTLAFSDGTTRFDMNLAEAKGDQIPEGAAAQLEQMGMAQMVMISRRKENVSYVLYPGLKSCVQLPASQEDTSKSAEDYDIEITEIGREEQNGLDCVKNKVVITDKDGKSQEATVWNASKLDGFPVRIETIQDGNHVAMEFKDVKLAKPSAAQFTPPADYKKYDNMMGLMQEIMMRRMGGAGATPGQ